MKPIGYCVTLIVPNYHPQLCGSDGTHEHPMSLQDASEACERLTCDEPMLLYVIMDWQAYMNHMPHCDDCKDLARLKEMKFNETIIPS